MKPYPALGTFSWVQERKKPERKNKERVTYPCYSRPNKTPVVLACEQAHFCEFRGKFSRPILLVYWQLCRQYFPRTLTSEPARGLLVCGLSKSPAVGFSRRSRFSLPAGVTSHPLLEIACEQAHQSFRGYGGQSAARAPQERFLAGLAGN